MKDQTVELANASSRSIRQELKLIKNIGSSQKALCVILGMSEQTVNFWSIERSHPRKVCEDKIRRYGATASSMATNTFVKSLF